jgi:hypothetical protein
MAKIIDITALPIDHENQDFWKSTAASILRMNAEDIGEIKLLKRSIDARKRPVVYRLRLEVFLAGEADTKIKFDPNYQNVANKPRVVIVGFGPAGLFAALECLKLGLKPVVLERGKNVRDRRRDLAAINKEHIVNEDSNYCFGEGGAGTYSDGKLYTRSHKRGKIEDILQRLVHHGASEDILIDAHPHIGTNKLPQIIVDMRETIEKFGGEVHFNLRIDDLIIEEGKCIGAKAGDQAFRGEAVILATGHSARDVFYLLRDAGVSLERKPFALGVRIEHSQDLIDRIQYKGELRGEHLPPASYALVEQVDGVGVYSFCMCPGGIIAPCASAAGEVVTNGWSPSKRNNPYSNSGIVVEITDELLDKAGYTGTFGALDLQKEVEEACWKAAGSTQAVPAQRMIDFVQNKVSKDLPVSSYQPGMVSVNLRKVLPPFIAERLAKAFEVFGQKMRGYLTNEAVLTAPESRTSSPIRIPRDRQTLAHVQVQGLYPCGEGAGYAGGIVSAAMDGQNLVRKIAEELNLD